MNDSITHCTILIVGPDSKLRVETGAALASVDSIAHTVHYIPDFRQGLEAIRSRRPQVVLVEMGRDTSVLKGFAEESAVASPETVVVAMFSPQVFGPDVSESAILIEAIRAGVKDFLRRPVSSTELEQLLARLMRGKLSEPGSRGKIVSFISNKGGVGKSTIAVSVATRLAQGRRDRVLLVDASLQMGVCATMLDLRPATSLTDAARGRDRLDETLLRQLATPHPCGLHVLAAPATAVEAAEIDDDVMSRVLTLARRCYDFVLVDTFPLLDGVVMAVLDLSGRGYIVLESVVPTVLGAAKLLGLLEELGFARERQRLVLNRYLSFSGNLKPRDVATRLGRTIDHVVPFHKKVVISANTGQPYALAASRFFGFGRAIGDLVREIEGIPVVSSAGNNGRVSQDSQPDTPRDEFQLMSQTGKPEQQRGV